MFGREAGDVLGRRWMPSWWRAPPPSQPDDPLGRRPSLVRVWGLHADGNAVPAGGLALPGRRRGSLALDADPARPPGPRGGGAPRVGDADGAAAGRQRVDDCTFDALESAVVLLDERAWCCGSTRSRRAAPTAHRRVLRAAARSASRGGEPWRTAIDLITSTASQAERTASRQTKDEISGRSWDVAASSVDVEGQVRHVVLARDESAKVRLLESVQQAEQMAAMGAVDGGPSHTRSGTRCSPSRPTSTRSAWHWATSPTCARPWTPCRPRCSG